MPALGHVLVLTAAAGVDDGAADAAGTALAAAGVRAAPALRLAATAVQIALPEGLPAGLDAGGLAVPGVDANVVPARGRRKQVLIADMDSTIITVECIDELAAAAGAGPAVAAVTEAAMRGDLDFEAALEARVRLLAGLPERVLDEVHDARVRLTPGARRMVRTMAALGADTLLVSGGFTAFSARVAAAAGFAHHQANVLDVADGRLTGRVVPPILGRAAKRAALEAALAGRGLGPEAALALGDGANDIDMVRAAGLGVAWRAKPALAAVADARLDHSDLTAVLALQGIGEEEWADD